jgi:pyrimidine operon attenuation protein/uracil phosphoribosyltransferase
MSRSQLLSPERVRRILARLAYEVVERNRGVDNVTVFGIRSRGVALGDHLARLLSEMQGEMVPVHGLDVTPFRDDLDEPVPVQPLDPVPVVAGRDVVLVDDVLFTGRTVRAAIDAVLHYGRPRSIQLAVLIDRGHREYPIQADYIGRRVPTKHRERVVVETDPLAVSIEE